MSWISAFIILLAGQSPSPVQDPAKEREALIRSLEAKFEALGPFLAEYTCGIAPDRTYRLTLHLDFQGRRAFAEVRPVGKVALKSQAMRMFSGDFRSMILETEALTLRRETARYSEPLDRALYDLRRLAIDSTKSPAGPDPGFPRILKPLIHLEVQERREPHGAVDLIMGFAKTGGASWLSGAADAAEAAQDEERKAWIFTYRTGRRVSVDSGNGLLRWVEIQVAGKAVRVLDLQDLKAPLPVPKLELTGPAADWPLTVKDLAWLAGRSTIEEFWETWPKVRGGPREAEFFAVWFRLAATVASLLEKDEIRTLARSYMDRECPDESPWLPDSEELKAAISRFVESIEKEKLAERRKVRLEEWRASLTLALEREEEDGEKPPLAAWEFLKKGFDGAAIETERGKLLQPDAAAVFRGDSALWIPIVHLRRGNEAQEKADHDRAIVQFGVALRLWPRFAGAYVGRGYARARKGDTGGAIEDFSKAIEIDPLTRNAHNYRGWAWQEKADFARAVEDFTKAIEQNPKDKGLLVSRGLCLRNQKDYRGAIRDLTKALELDPEDSGVYVWRGHAWWREGSFSKAQADFTRAIEVDPKNAEAYYFRGSLRREKRKDLAILDLEKALELAPKVWPHRESAENILRDLKK